jgi:hypothetical protein
MAKHRRELLLLVLIVDSVQQLMELLIEERVVSRFVSGLFKQAEGKANVTSGQSFEEDCVHAGI